jgi:hypothetical protein
MSNANEVKALLARAGVEINNALHRVDHMSAGELADTAKLKSQLQAAFFDKNGSCAAPVAADLAAVFDKNGSCAGRNVSLEEAFRNVLKPGG